MLAIALVIILTLVLVFSITYVSALSTFTSSFKVLITYALLVLCLNLINLILIVKTFAFAYTNILLKSSFTKVKEHTSKSYSLIVTSYFITLLKIVFKFIVSYIIFKYCFLRIFCFL